MKSRSGLFMLLVVVISMLVLAACGGAAAATEAPAAVEPAVMELPPPANDQVAQGVAPAGKSSAQQQAAEANAPAPMPTAAAYEIANHSGDLTVIERSNRMIVKNGDMRLTVKDTDVAIDRTTQIIGDAGGPNADCPRRNR